MPPFNDGCVGRGRGGCGCHPSMIGVRGGGGSGGLRGCHPSMMGVRGGEWIMRMPPLNDGCTGRGRGLWGCHPSMIGVRGGDVDYGDATPQ